MNLLAPSALIFSVLAAPLIAVYMLRARRQKREISSIMLWERTEEPVSSSVPWQRLPITWPLILQLLILAVFVALLARPFTTEATVLGPHTVLVIDTSGSMAMADRFEDARERALALADRASDENLISVVEAGATPKVHVSFSRDPADVVAAIQGLTVGGAVEDLEAAIRMARGLATPDRPTGLIVFSDGGDPDRVVFDVAIVDARHFVFDAAEDNVAISGFSVDVIPGEGAQVFVEVSNGTLGRREIAGVVEVDGLPARTFLVDTGAMSRGRDAFIVDAAAGAVVRAHLIGEDEQPLEDGLDMDNSAVAVVPPNPEFGVNVVGDGSVFLGALVLSTPGADLVDDGDVAILDGIGPDAIDRPTWLVDPPTVPPGVVLSGLAQNLAVSYQRPGEPILDHVDLSEVIVGEAAIVDAPGWVPIVSAGDVPLVLLGEVNGHRVVYTTFDLTHSNLVVQVAFPLMGSRILRWLSGDEIAPPDVQDAGAPIVLTPLSGETVMVSRPDGVLDETSDGALVYADTETPGLYSLIYRTADGVERRGAAQVRGFAAPESVGASQALPVVAPDESSSGAGTRLREIAPLLLVVVLLMSFVEWAVTHRRRRVARVVDDGERVRELIGTGGRT